MHGPRLEGFTAGDDSIEHVQSTKNTKHLLNTSAIFCTLLYYCLCTTHSHNWPRRFILSYSTDIVHIFMCVYIYMYKHNDCMYTCNNIFLVVLVFLFISSLIAIFIYFFKNYIVLFYSILQYLYICLYIFYVCLLDWGLQLFHCAILYCIMTIKQNRNSVITGMFCCFSSKIKGSENVLQH